MKKLIAVLLLVYFILSSSCVFAHSGGTDHKGGHYDKGSGEYHYHHGYSAHQHNDMDSDGVLDCPYNFVDKTDHNNSKSSSHSKSNYSYEEEPQVSSSYKLDYKKRNNLKAIIGFIFAIIVCIAIPWLAFLTIFS